MEFILDKFNGIIIDVASVPNDTKIFEQELTEILQFSSENRKGITWLSLPISQSQLIPVATQAGFVFHNCLEAEITLVHKSDSVSFVPFIPTHTLGAGALITNDDHELLVIKEHGMTGYKLPGGHIELAENIEESIIRETLEETGVKATFQSVVGMTTKHPYQFGKSNLYFICHLTADSQDIDIQDTHEIAEAKWISVDEFIEDEKNFPFNRQMVRALVGKKGLEKVKVEGNHGLHKKQEIFFSHNEL
ncbi:NUDIX domain-containing protein [Vibrio kagoshimensis]|uniref:NUDIX hydrolase n=1 Tax=Vibrio kagoshimensis TaxID=2910244 RepID=UPI003D1C2F6B